MSAHGGTITGGTSVHVPIRLIAVIVAVAATVAIAFAVIEPRAGDAGRDPSVAIADRIDWAPGTGHPFAHERPGAVELSPPVQRLYPDGFGSPVDDDGAERLNGVRRKFG